MNDLKKSYLVYPLLLAIGIAIGILMQDEPTSTSPISEEAVIYTCSMHPQVQQSEPGDCPLCGMDLIPSNQLSVSSGNGIKLSSEELNLIDVRTIRIRGNQKDANSSIRFTGRLEVDETNDFNQSSHFEGRVEKMHVRYTGQRVVRGEIIAEIYSDEWVQLQDEILLAQQEKNTSALLEALLTKAKNKNVSDEDIRTLLKEKKSIQTLAIKAESTGFVRAVFAKEGQYIMEGQSLYLANNFNSLWAVMDAREEDAIKVNYGDNIQLTIEGFNEVIDTKIDFIPTEIDPQSRRLRLRATISNPSLRYQSGTSFSSEIFTQNTSSTNTFTVPATAVLWTGTRSLVYLKQEGVFIPTEIKLGSTKGDFWVVQSGLQNGDEIAISGVFNLDAAAQLQGLDSMMNRSKNVYESIKLDTKLIENLLTNYIDLKNALVKADLNGVKNSSTALTNINNTLPSDWQETPFYQTLIHLDQNNANISDTRASFELVSNELYQLLKVNANFENDYYYQYCPMAFENRGAYWISEEESILNPYFGDSMLRCGETLEKLVPISNLN